MRLNRRKKLPRLRLTIQYLCFAPFIPKISALRIDLRSKKQTILTRKIIYMGAATLLLMTLSLVITLFDSWYRDLRYTDLDEALVTTPFKTVLLGFIKEHWVLFLNNLLAGFIVLALFVTMYKSANQLYQALSASTHDTLTGLYNRRYLDEQFHKLWLEAKRDHTPISVLFIDIDHFKRFNDQFGHEKGDEVLVNVSKLIAKCLLRPLDFSCRWGGEEFVVVMPQTPEHGALDVAGRILSAVSDMRTDFCGPGDLPITVSIGVASTYVTADNIHDDLVDQADKAMLDAKANGRNQLKIFGKLS